MEIIPAIDLKDGRCVRLYQGDFQQVTVYADDPAAVAREWAAMGAPRLHLVDLDGSRAGRLVNLDVVRRVCAAVEVPVQCAGGVRAVQDALTLIEAGADRVVVGTVAVADTNLVSHLVDALGERLVVAIDARDGIVATRGWQEQSGVSVLELARAMAARGVRRFLYTDIARDGTLASPNFVATAQLVEALRTEASSEVVADVPAVIASGGVASTDHLHRMATVGVEATVVGRALYTGHIRLSEALAALQGPPASPIQRSV